MKSSTSAVAKAKSACGDHLSRLLGDEWTLIMGYKNPKGEVDQILVGPSGVFALEIKFINGTVHCDGDRWWRDKCDRYGNLVETNVPIADKRGRGPSRQLNEAEDSLQQFLSRRIGEGRVRRAVVLSHDASRIGTVLDVRVDLVTTLATWDVRSFVGAPTVLDDEGWPASSTPFARTTTFMNSDFGAKFKAFTRLLRE